MHGQTDEQILAFEICKVTLEIANNDETQIPNESDMYNTKFASTYHKSMFGNKMSL